MSSVTKTVQSQYEDLPYPHRDPENEKKDFCIITVECPDVLNHICFGGEKDFTKPMRVLVAGGGTGDSVVFWAEMLRENLESEIVYVDLSSASREVAEARCEVRGLKDRVQWVTGSLLDIPEMDLGKFDIVNCSGVLHHLESPEDGLKALESVLKDDGVMPIMLYGKYGRYGVYPMQEMMRLINADIEDKGEKINNTKEMIGAMPQQNVIIQLLQLMPGIFDNDAEIYDVFLHSQDRAYTVAEIYEYAESAGLKLVDFCPGRVNGSRSDYLPEKYISNKELLAKIKKLDIPQQHAIAEILHSQLKKHQFYFARKAVPEPELGLDMIPSFAMSLPPGMNKGIADMVKNSQEIVAIEINKVKISFMNQPHLEQIFRNIDDEMTLRQIFKKVKGNPDSKKLLQEFRGAYEALHNHYCMFLRKKDVPGYKNVTKFQDYVNKMYNS